MDFSAGTVRLELGTTKNDEGRMFPFGAMPAGNTPTDSMGEDAFLGNGDRPDNPHRVPLER